MKKTTVGMIQIAVILATVIVGRECFSSNSNNDPFWRCPDGSVTKLGVDGKPVCGPSAPPNSKPQNLSLGSWDPSPPAFGDKILPPR